MIQSCKEFGKGFVSGHPRILYIVPELIADLDTLNVENPRAGAAIPPPLNVTHLISIRDVDVSELFQSSTLCIVDRMKRVMLLVFMSTFPIISTEF